MTVDRLHALGLKEVARIRGEMEQVKTRARQALGSRVDIRALHAQARQDGCMPLSMLETKIDAWIRERRPSSPS